MLAKITVAEYMSKRLVKLKTDTDVIEAIKLMLNHKITSAPVMDEQGTLAGMFSEKDGMKVVLESAYNQGMSGKVADFMTAETISVDADTSILELAETFKGSTVRSFPVYDDGYLVGVVSRSDVLRALTSSK
jgi:CBS domain-containing protein